MTARTFRAVRREDRRHPRLPAVPQGGPDARLPERAASSCGKIPEDGLPGEAILFNNADKIPLIPVRLGDREFAALIDSGSAAAIDINPAGLSPKFVSSGPSTGLP
jgi:hypothetical protein